MRRLILVSLSTLFFAGSIPKAKANPVAIPIGSSICSTGVGCIVLGIVVIGGIAYYHIQKPDGSRSRVRVDAKNNATRKWEPGSVVRAGSVDSCRRIAKKYGKRLISWRQVKDSTGGVWYDCELR